MKRVCALLAMGLLPLAVLWSTSARPVLLLYKPSEVRFFFFHLFCWEEGTDQKEKKQEEKQWSASIHHIQSSWPSLGCPKLMSRYPQKVVISAGQNPEAVMCGSRSSEKSFHQLGKASSRRKHTLMMRASEKVPIEPLIGTLRHPDTACGRSFTSRFAFSTLFLNMGTF